jgi:hypothetical protein
MSGFPTNQEISTSLQQLANFGAVRNGTALFASRRHDGSILHSKVKREPGNATLASVKKEMAKPRLAMSAREGEINLTAGRMVPVKRGNAKRQLRPLPLLQRAR